jgi:glutamate--cysteine ligase
MSHSSSFVLPKAWIEPLFYKPKKLEMALEIETFPYIKGKPVDPRIRNILEEIQVKIPNSTLQKDPTTGMTYALKMDSKASYSLEPGGQLEYSSHPHSSFKSLYHEVNQAFSFIPQDIDLSLHGTRILDKEPNECVVPKFRYLALQRYLNSEPQGRGLDMMRHLCTLQPNLDISWENLSKALYILTVLEPVFYYLFLNSYMFNHQVKVAERQNVWTHMDQTRSSYPPKWPLSYNDAPEAWLEQYAIYGQNAYVWMITELPLEEQPLYGQITFNEWYEKGYQGIFPQEKDWLSHLSTLFPFVRMRPFCEIRNIDCQPWEHLFAPSVIYHLGLQTQIGIDYLLNLAQDLQIKLLPFKWNNWLSNDSLRHQNEKFFQSIGQEILTFFRENSPDQLQKDILSRYSDYFQNRNEVWKSFLTSQALFESSLKKHY